MRLGCNKKPEIYIYAKKKAVIQKLHTYICVSKDNREICWDAGNDDVGSTMMVATVRQAMVGRWRRGKDAEREIQIYIYMI